MQQQCSSNMFWSNFNMSCAFQKLKSFFYQPSQTPEQPIRMTQVKESIAYRLRSRSEPIPSLIPREDSERPAAESSSQPATTGPQTEPSLVREDSASTVILISSDDDEDVLEDSRNSDGNLSPFYIDSEDELDEDYPYSDEDDYPYYGDEEPRAKVARLSDGTAVMPNLLEGVAIPEGPARTGEECSVCLDPPVHPVTLPCGHVFCFLCAKVDLSQSQSQSSIN